MSNATTVERIATWASELTLADVPTDVVALCRAQRQSVLGGVAASSGDGAAGRVLAAVDGWASDGPAPLLGTERLVDVEAALYGATALSIALDFDDYVCFGHTGHSAVLVPILLAAETGATARAQLEAQVVANEVEARLGGACLMGPLNGQLWSFIHAAGTALAAGRLLGLDRAQLAHALALSLYQAPRPTVPGFMAPDSKLLTAAEPTVIGLRAARLARRGVTGPLDVLDHPHGFFGAFSYVPFTDLLSALGDGWATRTLSVKRYPGCAYIDTTIDALTQLDLPPAADVAEVTVEASILTTEMDALSAQYATGEPTPVTVNFSIPWNVAIVLVAGRLTPHELDRAWLDQNAGTLDSLRRRVRLSHNWDMTQDVMDAFSGILPVRALLKGVPRGKLLRGARQVRGDRAGFQLTWNDMSGIARLVRHSAAHGARQSTQRLWSDESLSTFAMTFPSRVQIRHRNGQVQEAEVAVPTGGAGGSGVVSPAEAARAKLLEWGPNLWGADGTAELVAAIDDDHDQVLATGRGWSGRVQSVMAP